MSKWYPQIYSGFSTAELYLLSLCDENVVAFELFELATYFADVDLTQEDNCPSSQYLFAICY